jgi:two-component system CheB/CheR fusion protein
MKGCDDMVTNKTESKEKTQLPQEEQKQEEKQKPEEKQIGTAEETSINKPPVPNADPDKSSIKEFPIVGIGASAGGLAVFDKFFSAMPDSILPGMAFVLVQHLDPNHKSILTDLIGRYTHMPVYEVTDGMVVQPNCIYVIPPKYDMVLEYGTLQLQEPVEPRGHHLPIDLFFRSLALSKQEMAIGIILSGTGSDGTMGARAIKAEGGMVMDRTPNPASTTECRVASLKQVWQTTSCRRTRCQPG